MPERVTSRFDWGSTAAEVVDGVDLHGKRAVVTGGAGGIGVETVRALQAAGADVTVAARGTGFDLMDRASVDRFVRAWEGPLHLLVNNAGVMAVPTLVLSPEGHEQQFATNHLGHFRLFLGLLPALRAAGGARVVSVSSRAHLNSPVVFEDLDFASRTYDPALAYAQSKTANVLFAVELTRRFGGEGINANALHPGAIMDSGLSRHMDPARLEQLRTSGQYVYKSLEQGAACSVWAATAPELEGVGGLYFENCQQAVVDDPTACGTDAVGVAAHALDPAAAARLWDVSERLQE